MRGQDLAQIVTIIDAEARGCDLFDLDELRFEYNDEQFANLLMCEFVDDGASIFPLTMLQSCFVDSWVDWGEDYKPFAAKPLGDRPVWITEWADALPDYKELGMAINLNHARNQDAIRRQREAFARMVGVKNQTRSTSDRQAITHIVQQMAGELGIPYQLDLDS